MTYNISMTADAQADLRQIREYFSVELDNKKAAVKITGGIVKSIRQLKYNPEIGAPLMSRVDIDTDYRYLVCGNYNVFYRIEDSTVRITRIIGCRMNFMAVLFGEEQENNDQL